MKKIITVLVTCVITPLFSLCQTNEKTADEAFVLVRMVNKFHVEPRELNNKFSSDVFKGMLDKADPEKMLFTKNDVNRLSKYATSLDDEIKHRKTNYLVLFIGIYKRRLEQADSLINEIDKRQFDFFNKEKLTAAEDTLYPISLAAIQLKLYKKMKAWALGELTDDIPANFKTFAQPKQKKYIDSALVALQRKAKSSLKRRVDNILQNPYGITRYVGNMYCETIASCYDPHTEFFPPDERENFESELGKQPFQFGFKIKADKNGGILIDNLQPGSPAFKCGKLNRGDKFMIMQWEGGQAIDVSDMTTHEFGELIDEINHKKTLFTVKKADGSNVQVTLEKEQAKGGDEDRVKSFILKGSSTVGYIYLPAFYEDWELSNEGLNGCANDVGREILKLKKENINGLILDVRYNGGGSVSEATELAGIFIDAGPVAQEKSRDTKVSAIKDMDRGTIYDGPLVILVNGYSASASELLAGTLQDYNRAVIIGSPTYGKATMQVVLPMDTTVTPENFSQKQTENYLKVTTSKLYRVTGATAQFKGVQPDIVLPDILDVYITKEADELYAIKPTTIAANKYFTPYPPLPIKLLRQSVQTEIDTNRYFNSIKPIIATAKPKKATSDLSLNVNDALKEADEAGKNDDSINLSGDESKKFSVQSNQYEKDMIQADSEQKALNDEFRHQIAADAFVKIAYDVLAKLKLQ